MSKLSSYKIYYEFDCTLATVKRDIKRRTIRKRGN